MGQAVREHRRRVTWGVRRGLTLSIALTLAVGNVRLYLPPERCLPAILRHLDHAVRHRGAERMQRQFPEGFAFTHLLTGLAWAQAGPPGEATDRVVQRALTALDAPAAWKSSSAALEPPYGVFYVGWTAWLRGAELARHPVGARDPVLQRDFEAQCEALGAAFMGSTTPFLPSYPHQSWPVDSVVAVAALQRHDQLLPPRYQAVITAWLRSALALVDPRTGLLPHSVNDFGRLVEGSRGSSQALLLPFLAAIDPAVGRQQYGLFRQQFLLTRLGLPAIREYPRGVAGQDDVDSGPLLWGASPSASVVAVAAARANGDEALARALARTQECALLPLAWRGRRCYLGGSLPVLDGFVAWSRSVPLRPDGSLPPALPRGWRVPVNALCLVFVLLLWWAQSRSFRQEMGQDSGTASWEPGHSGLFGASRHWPHS